ncbi:putative ubiquitin-like modifier-activating enzyme 6-like [Apostichopus japonicus]|uniref:E1 ubiquitin-activating enzyme n=1 Tax=Stichopus japonicus TaxID=307972 RepID=A0A2G8LLM4_STIJA|nr:putative ubiquitin-like modifier-activating enzyme 6-like [Apostichopus japonicus]
MFIVRQRYVLGDSAMRRMAHSNVLIVGLGGLGIEIAKNIVLAGIKSLTVLDRRICQIQDLGTQFFIRQEDVDDKKTRAEASVDRLAELNPYVTLKNASIEISQETDLSFLKEYQCVVVTETAHSLLQRIDDYCRQLNPPIQFIAGEVSGVFSYAFCDFGPEFTVVDASGEEPKECFIADITKGNPGIVTSLDNTMHDFQSGDTVTFKEIKGMESLNGTRQKIKVVSPYSFSVCDTTGEEFQPYQTGGIAKQVKVSTVIKYSSLQDQMINPRVPLVDFTKDAVMSHVAFCSLHRFRDQHNRLPKPRCDTDLEGLLQLAEEINEKLKIPVPSIDKDVLRHLADTCAGHFAPLCAAMGGVIGQEVIKAVTGKFTPINQWLYLDASEVLKGLGNVSPEVLEPKGDRYDHLRICIGDEMCLKLADLKLFMVGCGAIGCEMMKNYALLGVCRSPNGKMTITDNDLIEKSNLNRQFLFRPRHIQKPKSTTAAESCKEINPSLNIEAHQHKVHPATEQSTYNDAFFEAQDVVVNALDNVEARRYMDIRCVTNQKALMESGTLGSKGHVQVIIPHLTETYGNQQDPPEQSVPYCTLKSFPATIEHTIPWARDKFESLFSQKPAMLNKFWMVHGSPEKVMEKLKSNSRLEHILMVLKLMKNRPQSWQECVAAARIKFERYYNHKAKQLLSSFPLDSRTKDGAFFWQSPKRPPTPVEFDTNSELHMMFIRSCSRLIADYCGIPYTENDTDKDNIVDLLRDVNVPEFVPSNKKIVTEETENKPETTTEDDITDEDIAKAIRDLKHLQDNGKTSEACLRMIPAEFEKDDDSNGHIDFMTSASNLRATMYSIETADRFKTKRIVGRIVPAIATTTAAVSGLVTIELIKYIQGCVLDDHRNAFLNLALPTVMVSEPAPANKIRIKDEMYFTDWDRWEVHGPAGYKMQDFVQYFKDKYKLTVSLVVQGTKMIYVSMLPGHKKRLKQTMVELIKPADGIRYVDLTIAFEIEDEEEDFDADGDLPAPPIRYFFDV